MTGITINSKQVPVVEFNGQRVVTLGIIDLVHERPEGTARKRLNDNRSRFVEGKHLFKVCASEFRTRFPGVISARAHEDVTLLTERGYLLLVKSFTDDLAWQVQDQLVDGYFAKRADVAAMLHDPQTLQRLLLENVTQVVKLKAENDDLHTENLMLEQKVVADAPKVEFANQVVVTHETYSVAEAAKLIGTGQNRLMSFLRMKGWVCVRKNEPKQWAIEKGYLSAKLHSYEHPLKGPTVESTARVTGKGLIKLRELWLCREEDLLSEKVGTATR